MDGGEPGRCARFIVDPGTLDEREMPALFSGLELHAGQIVIDQRGGGGGLGAPRERTFERVLDDVLDGYVSAESAVESYGADPARLAAGLAAWHNAALAPL
jgi:N-methylhydantoinase B